MSNLAKIVKASKDPRCIMSVIPNNGGTWASSISSITPQPVTADANLDEPNISKRLKLLELDNTDTSGGVFKSADLTQDTWYGKTALNLAGRSTSFTALGKMYIAPDSGAGTTTDYDMNVFHPLMQQGYTQSGGVDTHVFGLLYESLYGSKRYRAAVSLQGDTPAALIHNVPVKPTDTVVTMATTFNLETGIIKLYLDGVMIRQATAGALAGGTLREDTSNGANTDSVYIRQLQAGWQNRNDKIYWAMVYDGILSDTEIKYLST